MGVYRTNYVANGVIERSMSGSLAYMISVLLMILEMISTGSGKLSLNGFALSYRSR